MVPREIDRPTSKRVNFAFETNLSGRTYVPTAGLEGASYRIQIEFLRLSSVDLALPRIEARVRQLGHDVPSQDVLRRFDRGTENFLESTNPWRNSGLCMTIHGRRGGY
jgi:predicted ABC-type ATPase